MVCYIGFIAPITNRNSPEPGSLCPGFSQRLLKNLAEAEARPHTHPGSVRSSMRPPRIGIELFTHPGSVHGRTFAPDLVGCGVPPRMWSKRAKSDLPESVNLPFLLKVKYRSQGSTSYFFGICPQATPTVGQLDIGALIDQT